MTAKFPVDFYPLKEAVKLLGIRKKDFLHYVSVGQIVPALFADSQLQPLEWEYVDASKRFVRPQASTLDSQQQNPPNTVLYLRFPKVLAYDDCYFTELCTSADAHPSPNEEEAFGVAWFQSETEIRATEISDRLLFQRIGLSKFLRNRRIYATLEAQVHPELTGILNEKKGHRLGNKSDIKSLTKQLPELRSPPQERRRLNNELKIIASLVELMLDETPGKNPVSVYRTQTAIIDALLAKYPNIPGLSQSNLQTVFAEAKRLLKSQ